MSNWNILCPGKSLSKLPDDYELCTMRTVAVNQARLKRKKIGIWALQDYEVFSKCDQGLNMNYPALLWIPDSWLTHWAEWRLPKEEFLYNFPLQTYSKSGLRFSKKLWEMRQFKWDKYTVFTAIALCILNDAVNINIIGMDLEGEGYYMPGMENERTIHNAKRWGDEEQMFKTCQSICDRNGINLRRIEL